MIPPLKFGLSAHSFICVMVAMLGLLSAKVSQAQLIEGLRLSGYGTIGYVQDNRKDIVAIRDISQRPDLNLGRGSWERDTRLGFQMEYHVSPLVDLVAQAVFRDQVSNDFGGAIELAYAGIQPTSSLDVRIGRVGYGAFLMSDIRNVGYAYPWVRPFTEYYGWIPLFSVDGIDVAYVIPDGDGRWRLRAQIGHSAVGIPIGESKLDFKTENLVGFSLARQSGPWETKLGYSTFTSRNEVSPGGAGGGLFALQQGLGAIAIATAVGSPLISSEAADLQQNLSFRGARIRYLTLGVSYNDGTWLLQGELARTVATHTLVPHGTMGYAVIGYHSGDWLPYVAISATRPGNGLRSAVNDWSVIAQAATQATALANLNSSRMDQTTLSIGTRWDFSSRAALKVQLDSTRIAPNGYGLLFKDAVLVTRAGRMNQLNVTLDFLF